MALMLRRLMIGWLLTPLAGLTLASVLVASGTDDDYRTCKMRGACQHADATPVTRDRGPEALRGTTDVVSAFDPGRASAAPSRRDVVLRVDGRVNSTPTVAADGAFVAVAWGAALPDGATDIYAAVSRDGVATFGAPVRVNAAAGDARVNGEQPPRVVLVSKPQGAPAIVVVWTTKGKSGTKLVTARSDDGGRTFGATSAVPGSDAEGNRGWENAVADAQGHLFAVWLDHREMADHSMAAGHHQHGEDPSNPKPASAKPDGVAMAQMSKLFISGVSGELSPRPITAGVCYCCKTAIAVGGDGSIYVAWRHVYPGNVRDIAFTVSRTGGQSFSAPIRVSEDGWMLEGCPDDGPAMAVDGSGRVHVVWPTLITDEKSGEPTIGIFYATSADGRSFTPRVRVPTEGVAHHPQIAIAGDVVTLAWDEGAGGRRRIVTATASAAADRAVAFTRAAGDEGGVYPSLATAGSATIVAWTASQPSGSVIGVQRIVR